MDPAGKKWVGSEPSHTRATTKSELHAQLHLEEGHQRMEGSQKVCHTRLDHQIRVDLGCDCWMWCRNRGGAAATAGPSCAGYFGIRSCLLCSIPLCRHVLSCYTRARPDRKGIWLETAGRGGTEMPATRATLGAAGIQYEIVGRLQAESHCLRCAEQLSWAQDAQPIVLSSLREAASKPLSGRATGASGGKAASQLASKRAEVGVVFPEYTIERLPGFGAAFDGSPPPRPSCPDRASPRPHAPPAQIAPLPVPTPLLPRSRLIRPWSQILTGNPTQPHPSPPGPQHSHAFHPTRSPFPACMHTPSCPAPILPPLHPRLSHPPATPLPPVRRTRLRAQHQASRYGINETGELQWQGVRRLLRVTCTGLLPRTAGPLAVPGG